MRKTVFYLQQSQFCLDLYLETGKVHWLDAFSRWALLARGASILHEVGTYGYAS